jgi:hypothetical protein
METEFCPKAVAPFPIAISFPPDTHGPVLTPMVMLLEESPVKYALFATSQPGNPFKLLVPLPVVLTSE